MATKRALSWFKESALAQITQARDVLELLQAHDILVQTLTTERPGYVVYEDTSMLALLPHG